MPRSNRILKSQTEGSLHYLEPQRLVVRALHNPTPTQADPGRSDAALMSAVSSAEDGRLYVVGLEPLPSLSAATSDGARLLCEVSRARCVHALRS